MFNLRPFSPQLKHKLIEICYFYCRRHANISMLSDQFLKIMESHFTILSYCARILTFLVQHQSSKSNVMENLHAKCMPKMIRLVTLVLLFQNSSRFIGTVWKMANLVSSCHLYFAQDVPKTLCLLLQLLLRSYRFDCFGF